MSTTATDNREQRDAVASDCDNDRVVDERGNPVRNVKLQKTPSGVDDALWGAAESLGSLDRFEWLPEADNAPATTKVDWLSSRAIVSTLRC